MAASSARQEQETQQDEAQQFRLLLIGKTGNGKSAAGNTLLGEKIFKESLGIISATETAQSGKSSKHWKVVDTPDVWSQMEGEAAVKEVKKWKDLTSPFPHAILLIIRADMRFTQEEYANFLKTKELMKTAELVRKKGKLLNNLVVVFTMWDKLSMEVEEFEKELQITSSELKEVMQEAKGCVVLDNTVPQSQFTLAQLDKLQNIISDINPPAASRGRPGVVAKTRTDSLRLVLVGDYKSGKTYTANNILGERKFTPELDTKKSATITGFYNGCRLEVTDTEGMRKVTRTEIDEAGKRVKDWFPSRGVDAVLLVVNADAITKADYNVYKVLKHAAGERVNKYVIVVFTHEDVFAAHRPGTTLDIVKKGAPESFQKLISAVGNDRLLMFDNRTTDKTKTDKQRDDLIKLVTKMKESNTKSLKILLKIQESQESESGRSLSSWQPSRSWLSKCGIS